MTTALGGLAYLVGHTQQGVSLLDSSRLDLTHDHRTHFVVLFGNWEHEWRIDVSVHDFHVVHEVDECRAPVRQRMPGNKQSYSLVPSSNLLINGFLHVLTHLSGYRDKGEICLWVESK